MDEDKQLTELNKENKQIRNELKRINYSITSILNHYYGNLFTFLLVETYKKKVNTRHSPEVRQQELMNMMKQLEYTKTEYMKYKERLEQLSNTKYTIQLQERNTLLTHKTRQLQKDNKLLEYYYNKDNYTEDIDSASALKQEIISLSTEILEVNERLNEVKKRLQNGVSQEQLSRFFGMKERWKELVGESNELSDNNTKGSDLSEEYKKLKTTKENVMKVTNLLKTRYTNTMSEYKQRIFHAKLQITRITELLQQKNMYFFYTKHRLLADKKKLRNDMLSIITQTHLGNVPAYSDLSELKANPTIKHVPIKAPIKRYLGAR